MKCQYYSPPKKNRIRPQILILLIIGLIILPKSSLYAESAIMLYDIDFGTPPHTVGQAPVVGTGSIPRNTPTSINFAGPKVVDAVGAFTNQPVQFTVPGSKIMAQLEFGITSNEGFSRIFPRYIIEMDILVASLALPIVDSGFTIILDTPQVRRIDFEPDESIRMFNPKIGTEIIGGYSLGVPVALSVFVDLESDQWTVSVDDTQIYSGIFGASELKKFRINLGDYEHQGNIAAVDNIKVYGVSDSDTLIGLDIIGSEEVPDNSLSQYAAIASYDDGSTADVTSFSILSLESETYGNIDEKGVLKTKDIPGDITIYAQYTEGDIIVDAQKIVSCILDLPACRLNKIYWTSTTRIHRSDLDGTNIEELVGTRPSGLALDIAKGKMYWTDSYADKIQRANLDGYDLEDIITADLSNPRDIVLDTNGGKMYWLDDYTKIRRANVDGSDIEDLIITGLTHSDSIALDVIAGKMYWTNHRTFNHAIQRANLDGSEREDLVKLGSINPSGIALDVAAGKMYWTNSISDKIQYANLDGSGIEDIVTPGSTKPNCVTLDAAVSKMYWVDRNTKNIQRANLDGSGVKDIVTDLSSPSDIALYIPFTSVKLIALGIQGSDEVRENSQMQYRVIAHYDTDPPSNVTLDVTNSAFWAVEPNSLATIDAGLLRTNDINEPQIITIYVQYAEGNITLFDTIEVEVTFPRQLNVPTEYETIQDAIDCCINGDIVIVAPDTHSGIGNRDIDFNGKAITVRGSDPCDSNVVEATIIDCNGSEIEPHRGFYFHKGESEDSVLAGLTIKNGYAPDKIFEEYFWGASVGGAIFCDNGSSPTITNCIIRDNFATYGGGICCDFLTPYLFNGPRIINCIFTNNSAEEGGALYCINSNSLISQCTITGNTANHDGGGILMGYNNSTITNCKIVNNRSKGWGGGIGGGGPTHAPYNGIINNCVIVGNSANSGGGVRGYSGTITNCFISGNRAGYGGGVDYSKCLVNNSIISGNVAEYWGGGFNSCEGIIRNCTIIGDKAGWSGGGLFGCDVDIFNCIFSNNTNHAVSENRLANRPLASYCLFNNNPDGDWYDHDTRSTLIGADAINSLFYVPTNIDGDPSFIYQGYWADVNDPNVIIEPDDPNAMWVDGDYHLLPDSPCIDAGDPNYIAEPNETDLDGKPRVIGGRIDMGAYESPVPAEVRIVPRTINLTSKGKWITCHISLPEDYDVTDIDPNSIFLEYEIQAELLKLDEEQQVAIAKFSRSDVQGILNPPMADQVELTITGQLTDGTQFEGTDTIKVIDKAGKN